jgi:hypothetical protein
MVFTPPVYKILASRSSSGKGFAVVVNCFTGSVYNGSLNFPLAKGLFFK